MAKKNLYILIPAALVFALIYCWLATPLKTGANLSPRFDWPDETANYFWAANFAQKGELAVAEPLNVAAKNQIHPRSFNVRGDGALVPGSFLGLILLYGILAKIFSLQAIIYFTPLLAILGALAFYGIIRKIFDDRVALLSAILMLFHPAWWYYSATSLLPNAAFTSLILLSVYFLLSQKKINAGQTALAGLLLGIAITLRPSEIIWLAMLYFGVWLMIREKIKIGNLINFAVIALLAVLPTLIYQQITYGSFLVSGYAALQNSQAASCQWCNLTSALLLPFGFHPILLLKNFYVNFVCRFWWFSILAAVGLIAFLFKKGKKDDKIFGYIIFSLIIFGWLAVYYGSWQFSDLEIAGISTIGSSYIRYWLPLYLLSLPFAALVIIWLADFFKGRVNYLVMVFLVVIAFLPSADLVLRAKADSLLPVRGRIAQAKILASEVISLTENNSVIITVRRDKVFFPERKVIHTFLPLTLNGEAQEILPGLLAAVPVYYYALAPEEKLNLTNGLRLVPVRSFGPEILYKIE